MVFERGYYDVFKTFTRDLQDAATTRENDEPMQASGSINALVLELTEKADDAAGAPVANAKIVDAIDRLTLEDQNGEPILDMTGRQLERIGDILSPYGENVAAPAPGDGVAAVWRRYIPISIDAADLPVTFRLRWTGADELYGAANRPTVTMSLGVRMRTVETPVPTVRMVVYNPNHQKGRNDLGLVLPKMRIVDGLMILPDDAGATPLTDALVDNDGVTLIHRGVLYVESATPENSFAPEDFERRRDGHIGGVLNVRVPPFVPEFNTRFTLGLTADANFILLVISRENVIA